VFFDRIADRSADTIAGCLKTATLKHDLVMHFVEHLLVTQIHSQALQKPTPRIVVDVVAIHVYWVFVSLRESPHFPLLLD
jgi:hypothetical protein